MKKLHRDDLIVTFDIWHPRYSDNRVLLNAEKVDRAKTDNLRVIFTKARSIEGDWYISRKHARRFPKQSNDVILCYSIPLKSLQPLIITNEIRAGEVW